MKREHARLQRLNIEQRNLEQPQLPETELRARLEALSEMKTRQVPIIAAAQDALTASRDAQQHILTTAESVRAHVRELERLLQVHVTAHSRELQAVGALTQTAEVRKRSALADLARAVLTSKSRIALDAATLEELLSRDEEVAKIALEHAALMRALDNFDRSSVKRGLTLLIVAIAAIACGILAILLI